MPTTPEPSEPSSLATACELQDGVACLSRGAFFHEASLDMALGILAESAARVSRIARVGIWGLADDGRQLDCLELFDLRRGRCRRGERRSAGECPAYFRALREEACIIADDALTHPATSELAPAYLLRHRVTAVLEAPIHIRGALQGVLSLEQVGTREPWGSAHRLFAHAVANLVALGLVEYEAEQARHEAQSATARLRALFAKYPAPPEYGKIPPLPASTAATPSV